MKTNIIQILPGSSFGALLAGAAVFAACKGNLAIAGIMIMCQAVAFAMFLWGYFSRQKVGRTSPD